MVFKTFIGKIPHMDNYDSSLNETIGESETFLSMQQKIALLAPVERPVLILGERGTGKEKAARRLHFMSKRWDGPLVTLNCASLPPSLIESELFGWEKGAFTGAYTSRKGRFEEADGGTLFLDEMGLIPLSVQEKILRVVEYGTFERVGSSESRCVDVRIIGATNADLRAMCREGRFREDLLDRLSFDVIFVPPLRYRGGDIMLLAQFFAVRMAAECGRNGTPVFSRNAEKTLLSYPWPGNIRELKNAVERAVYSAEGEVIEDIIIDPFRNPYENKNENDEDDVFSRYELSELRKAKEDADVSFMKRALKESGGNQKRAAELLSISYDSFRGLYRKYGNVLIKESKKE